MCRLIIFSNFDHNDERQGGQVGSDEENKPMLKIYCLKLKKLMGELVDDNDHTLFKLINQQLKISI